MTSWIPYKHENLILHSSHIHLWRVRLPSINFNLNFLTGNLLPEEIKKANRYYKEIDKMRFIVARGILKKIISLYIKKNAKNISLSYSQHFKPYLAEDQNPILLKFNVTHAGDWIAFAFALENEIGVDIEEYKNDFDIVGAAKLVFSPMELEQWHLLPEKEKIPSFFHIWSCKEAFMKALGLGFHYPPEKVTVSIFPSKPCALLDDKNENHNVTQWRLESFFIDDNYSAAFAIKKENFNVSMYEWELDY